MRRRRGESVRRRPVPIPDGLEYKGSVAVEYDREAESVLFTGRLPGGKDCPPPEPPPP